MLMVGLVLGAGFVGCVTVPSIPVLADRSALEPVDHAPAPERGEAPDFRAPQQTSLEELLGHADRHAPVIATARARARIASAAKVDANIPFPANPQLSFAAGGRTSAGSTRFSFEVAIAQQLELGNQAKHRLAAARLDEKYAHALVNEVRWTVHVEVHRMVVHLLLLDEREAHAERFVGFSRELHTIVEGQIAAGERAPLVRLVAEADIAQSREMLIEVRRRRAELETRLAAIIGWPHPRLPRLEGSLPAVVRAPSLERLFSLMVEHHPSLRSRNLAVAARRGAREVAIRKGLPRPTVGARFEREPGLSGSADAHIWTMQLTVPIPVWRRNRGGIARAEAEIQLAQREREQDAIQLRTELTAAVTMLNAAAEQVEIYADGVVPHLQENLRLLERAYALGEVDLDSVSLTRQRLFEAGTRYLDARVAYYESAATLEGFVGTEIWEGGPRE